MRKYQYTILCAGILLFSGACKQDSSEKTIQETHLETSAEGGSRSTAQGDSRPQAQQNTGHTDASGGQDRGGEKVSSTITIPTSTGKRWWDNRNIFFRDVVGNTSDIVLQAIAGQHYFPETKIFVYVTDEAMEGTYEYTKIENTIESTELDDRIFIWVHLSKDKQPLFVKKLISDNIKDKIDQGPLVIE